MENRLGTGDAPAQGEPDRSWNRGDGEELVDCGRKRTVVKWTLNEAILLAEHVENINGLKMITRKIEAL